jgi:DNA mismatch repair protein MutL
MADIINLLPDAVANQIAAGEVIQRPASVVKELMENAIDSGATEIKLHIKDAGKTLIQVIDNGYGMSENDARMCWERHATSKLKTADDLFNIKTKGFRGEALASMAAIAHVELNTRREDFELGSRIIIEGSEVKSQEPVSTAKGSRFSVKNLFFNVPARRNFLKSDPVETRHIIEEFQRIAIAHPGIRLSLYNNEKEVFILLPGNLKQRLIALLGKKYAERLLQVEAETDFIKIHGFIAKPEFARKSRGEQYFFVNQRFIKSPYLNHAVSTAFSDLIPKDVYASYFIFFEIDPHAIDVNIHPTKTEIKFEDERNIYAILMAAVKQALGRFNAAPTIDFNQPEGFEIDVVTSKTKIIPPEIQVNKDYNPFTQSGFSPKPKPEGKEWESFYDLEDVMKEMGGLDNEQEETGGQLVPSEWKDTGKKDLPLAYQFKNAFIITTLKSSLVIIDQYRAHFRVIYEQLLEQLDSTGVNSQKLLFPQPFYPSVVAYHALSEMKEWLEALGFSIDWRKGRELLISGTPADYKIKDPLKTLQYLADEWTAETIDKSEHPKSRIAINLAAQLAVKKGKKLKREEIEALIEGLFSCENPYFSPRGNPVMFKLTLEEIQHKFE